MKIIFADHAKSPTLWLSLAYVAVSAALTLLVYSAVQQTYRQSANDPQIQLAEDTATALTSGSAPKALVPAAQVDMFSSLAPFLIVTNENRQVLASSGQLNGQIVLPPAGAFEAAKSGHGKDTAQANENRVTWQPAPSVREAAVIVHYNGGYVVAARSLREVEIHERRLSQMAALAMSGLLGVGIVLLLAFKQSR